MEYDISYHKDSHLWKWFLVIGAVFIIIGIYLGGKLRDDLDWDYEVNNHCSFWALALVLVSILTYIGLVGLEQSISDKLTITILIQLGLGAIWAYFMWKQNVTGLIVTQIILLVSILYMMVLFANVSDFGFWVSLIYFFSVLYATIYLSGV